ncbi:MAG: hypothetical protein QOI80_1235 [Solirubrobacteraceae bacterium]|nr:hypothetical protein [Solirubrobacteraceae bacterium]
MNPVEGKEAAQPAHRVPAEGSEVIQPHARRLASVRARVRRVPGLARAYRRLYEASREVVSAGYALRARIQARRGGDQVGPVGQSVPRWDTAADAALAPDGSELAIARPTGTVAAARDAALTANALAQSGIGLRAYDAGLLTSGAVGVVLEPSRRVEARDERVARVERAVRELLAAGRLAPRQDDWADLENFCHPAARPEEVSYRGIEHLTVPDPAALVAEQLTPDARSGLHFGREIALRGGRYIYQSVPSAKATGRRDTSRRWSLLASMLRDAGGVRDRVVLDVGCNAGMMLGSALSDGAAWGVGWDLPDVIPHARRLLLSMGYTRFDLTGAEMGRDYDLRADVPARVRDALDGSIVLYLAIRHHVGFLRSLADIPWSHMVYEGGETEDVARLDESLEELRAFCDVTVLAATDFRDGETKPRPVALLRRDA